jgi:nucleotide-binding universal stress UspA family protein
MARRSENAGGKIIVGVDGSEPSANALRWAADEAQRRDVGLHDVTCWNYPMLPEFLQAAREVAETEVDKVLGVDRDSFDVTVEVLEGSPSLRLLDFDRIGEMLVVGTRGRGGFAGLLLGSVSQHLTEHAHCPVIVVPGSDRPA